MKTCRTTLGMAALLAAGTLAGSALAQAQEAVPKPETNSQQPVGDAWITTKVKADLLASQDVSGLDIKVETRNGVVRLTGDVESKAQIDKAVSIAKSTKGVTDVNATGLRVAAGANK